MYPSRKPGGPFVKPQAAAPVFFFFGPNIPLQNSIILETYHYYYWSKIHFEPHIYYNKFYVRSSFITEVSLGPGIFYHCDTLNHPQLFLYICIQLVICQRDGLTYSCGCLLISRS